MNEQMCLFSFQGRKHSRYVRGATVSVRHFHTLFCMAYRIAGYIGRNNIWRIARKRKKIAFGGYKFGGYDTIATPSPGVYAVGAILADLMLAV